MQKNISDVQINPAKIYTGQDFVVRFKVENIIGMSWQELAEDYTYNDLKKLTYNEIIGG